MTNTLILNYNNMRPGGIEIVFSYLIEYALKNDYRVIWITFHKNYDTTSFKELLYDNKVENAIGKENRKSTQFLKLFLIKMRMLLCCLAIH